MSNNASAAKTTRARVLVVSSYANFPGRTSGEGSWELAEVLSRHNDVILALPETTDLTHREFAVVYYNQRNLGLIARDSDAVVCDLDVIDANSFFKESGMIATAAASLGDGLLARAELEGKDSSPDDYFIWTPPEEKHRYGLRHYARKLRYYLRTGGVRYTVSRMVAASRRKLKRSR